MNATQTQSITSQKSFMAGCREFFGVKEGQTALQFGKEVQALSHSDKVEIHEGLVALGVHCAAPTSIASA